VIISFTDKNYKEIALNWAKHLEKLKIFNFSIVCVDKDSESFLSDHGVPTILNESWTPSKTHGTGWANRTKIIYNLLKQNDYILHSDLDAVWVKNPLNFIPKNTHDIVSSCGTFPRNIFQKIGLTCCMGWIFYKSNRSVYKLFDRVLDTDEDFDDQVRFNNLMLGSSQKNALVNIDDHTKDLRTDDLYIRFLSQKIISREQKIENAYVKHPYSPKSSDRKKFLKSEGLWLL